MRFPAARDRPVADALRALPDLGKGASGALEPQTLFARATLHGVGGVLWDAWKAAALPIDAALAQQLAVAAVARDLDYGAHLAALREIDGCLTTPAVALKGPLLARRYYPRPSARGTSDIDLLVDESELAATIEALAPIGYSVFDSQEEIAWSRREHHHLHLIRANAPDLELHFHAYRGFGVTLRTEALAARSVPAEGFAMLRVPSAEDELVYLAAHAAAHRFGRLSWLYDLRLVVESMSTRALELAAERARAVGFSRVVALAGELLVETLGVSPHVVRPLGHLEPGRRAAIHAVVAEPESRLLSSASRFAYTTLLADTLAASLRYASASSVRHTRSLLGRG